MKIKLETIYNSLDSFKLLMVQELPVPVSYKFTQLFKKLNVQFTVLENKRLELVKEFGEEQEDGVVVVKDEDRRQEFLSSFHTQLQEEVELEWKTIKIEDMGTKVTMTVPNLNKLSFLFSDFEEEEETKKKEESVSV